MKKLLLALFGAAMALTANSREPQEGWKQLGTGTFCDDMLCFINENYLATWEVEIEESIAQPGMYRLVNPFGNGKCPYFTTAFDANDLVIDATDPLHVWIPKQDIGELGDWGMFTVRCMIGMYVEAELTIEDLIDAECLFGILADGKITFPDDDGYRLQPSFANYLEGFPIDSNTHGKFLVTLPDTGGINDVLATDEDSPVEYYTLQGIRVQDPGHGIFIRRQGASVTKIAR